MEKIKTLNINVSGMDLEQETKTLYAAELVLQFFQSSLFRLKLNSTDLLLLRGESVTSISKRLSKEEVYALFMTGREEWNGEADYEIDLSVKRYFKRWSKVVGYIVPMKPDIWVNGKFFDSNPVELVASNLAHEWSHTLGFRHSGEFIRESLPYLINQWFMEWYRDNPVVPKSPRSYETVCRRVWYKLWLGKKCYKRLIVN